MIMTAERMEMIDEITKLSRERAEKVVECTQNILKNRDFYDNLHILSQCEIIQQKEQQLYDYLESLDYADLIFIEMLVELGGEGSSDILEIRNTKKESSIVSVLAEIAPLDIYLKKGVEKLLIQ